MKKYLSRFFEYQLGVFLVVLFFSTLSGAKERLQYSLTANPTEELIVKLLELGLQYSGAGSNYELVPHSDPVNEARKVQMLQDGELHIVWMGTQKRYENELYPVRIPILKGMLGHRIFIIRKGDQSKFDSISLFSQLKTIPLGQGKFWGDTEVLKQANMTVIDPVKYESLFYMLEGGRFDFFPRALHEPWSEVASRPELNLTVESRHLLIYPFALYYFVSKENKQLGDELHQGLRKAIDEGAYDKLFYEHSVIRETLTKSRLGQRIVHRLKNPNMSPQTPTNDATLWLDIDSL